MIKEMIFYLQNSSINIFYHCFIKIIIYLIIKVFIKNEKEWNILKEVIGKIKDKILSSELLIMEKNQLKIITDIISFDKSKSNKIINEIEIYFKQIKLLFFNYLLKTNLKKDFNDIIIFLYDNIINDKEIAIHKKISEINFNKSINLAKKIYIISKIKFEKLLKIIINNCNLNNTMLNDLKTLFSANLNVLNLSANEIDNLDFLSGENCLII